MLARAERERESIASEVRMKELREVREVKERLITTRAITRQVATYRPISRVARKRTHNPHTHHVAWLGIHPIPSHQPSPLNL